ncbi:hypothetical protein ASALC70_02848 [Alcanivorax sp. ALC70]|nr:hypothetical protein ASALC70_02848 [Alcanivorax sp. ALC70]
MSDDLLDPALVREASRWLARLGRDDVDDTDRAACDAWRRADPRHERVWQRLLELDGALRSVPAHAARSDLLTRRAPLTRRQVLGLGAAAFTVGALGYGGARQGLWRRQWADLATGVGETATHTLADGTRLVLNTDTALDVDFNDRGREIRLHRGEVLVTTGHGDARPFRVRTRDGAVRPLGTRFTVRRTDRDTRVAVYQGAVSLRAGGKARPVRLDAGHGAAFRAGRVGAPRPLAEEAPAWQRGQLVAERMTVADFAGELARYRHGLVRYQPEVAGLRVTGVFSLTDTDRALDALARALPVRVRHYTPLWIRIEKKGVSGLSGRWSPLAPSNP